jgi:hypothetical protein
MATLNELFAQFEKTAGVVDEDVDAMDWYASLSEEDQEKIASEAIEEMETEEAEKLAEEAIILGQIAAHGYHDRIKEAMEVEGEAAPIQEDLQEGQAVPQEAASVEKKVQEVKEKLKEVARQVASEEAAAASEVS